MTSSFCRWVSEIYDCCVWIYGFGYFAWWWVFERGVVSGGLGLVWVVGNCWCCRWGFHGWVFGVSLEVWEFCLSLTGDFYQALCWVLIEEKLLEPTRGLLIWSSQVLPTNRNMTAGEKDESASINHTCKET